MANIKILNWSMTATNGRLLGDHAVERGKPRLGDRTRDMSGGAVGREVLGEREVHGLGVVVEEDLDHRDADRAAIERATD